MLSARLAVLAAAAAVVSSQSAFSLAPAPQASQDSSNAAGLASTSNDGAASFTDVSSIFDTANIVQQKQGAPSNSPPTGQVAATTVTAVDGQLVNATVPNIGSRAYASRARRSADDYEMLFEGAPAGQADAAVFGTAFLTWALVPNDTYASGLDACMDECDSTNGCVFVNMYRQVNNPLYDFELPEQSNLKCVLYGKSFMLAEKTDWGTDSLLPSMHIEESSGYAVRSVADPETPEGYEFVFGPIKAATQAAGYMGFVFLDQYNVSACAAMCSSRGVDPKGGVCQFFNIWTAEVNGTQKTYTCSMYYLPTDASTATNTGQGNLTVANSRGYSRIQYILNGGFEQYVCSNGDIFCFSTSAPNWIGISPFGGFEDATIFHYAPYAHTGNGSALLGCAYGTDTQMGVLQTTAPIAKLDIGRTYLLNFFHWSGYSGQQVEKNAIVSVWWGNTWLGNITGYEAPYTYHEYPVVAGKNNTITFIGGRAPAYSFLDDVGLFML
ncbi:hypothetical protein HMN09_00695400 [Mycena chlorophos]|uniref:Fruit-body specific protein a n=1 Tax=Mycena chlorophos TaxID=658473 RepID=A0A8H6SY96_MYCCL|nr:hypothetical protein HMN09_00695400 [Mycena chlorophos]